MDFNGSGAITPDQLRELADSMKNLMGSEESNPLFDMLSGSSLEKCFELRRKCSSNQEFRRRYWKDLHEFCRSGVIADSRATVKRFPDSLNEAVKALLMAGGFIGVLSDAVKFGAQKCNYDLTNSNAADLLGMIFKLVDPDKDRALAQIIKQEVSESNFIDVALSELTQRKSGFVGKYHILNALRHLALVQGVGCCDRDNFFEVCTYLLRRTSDELVKELKSDDLRWEIDGILPYVDEDKVITYAPRYFDMYLDNAMAVVLVHLFNSNLFPRENYTDMLCEKNLIVEVSKLSKSIPRFYVEGDMFFKSSKLLAILTSIPEYYLGELEYSVMEAYDALHKTKLLDNMIESLLHFLDIKNVRREIMKRLKAETSMPVTKKSSSEKEAVVNSVSTRMVNHTHLLLSILANLSEYEPFAKEIGSHAGFDRLHKHLRNYLEDGSKVRKKMPANQIVDNGVIFMLHYYENFVMEKKDLEVSQAFGKTKGDDFHLVAYFSPMVAQASLLLKNVQRYTDRSDLISAEKLTQLARRMKAIYNEEFMKRNQLGFVTACWGYTTCYRLTEDNSDACTYLNNRCEAFLRLGLEDYAQDDAQAILEMEPDNEKAQRRLKRAEDALKKKLDTEVL